MFIKLNQLQQHILQYISSVRDESDIEGVQNVAYLTRILMNSNLYLDKETCIHCKDNVVNVTFMYIKVI